MWNQLSDDAKAILQGLAAPTKAHLSISVPPHPLQAHAHAATTTGGALEDTNNPPADRFHDCAPERNPSTPVRPGWMHESR